MMCKAHFHHHILSLVFKNALPGLHCSHLQFFCLFLGLSDLIFAFSNRKAALLGRDEVTDLELFPFKKFWVASTIRSLSICTMKCYPITFVAFGWMRTKSIYSAVHLRSHLATSVSSHIITNTSEPVSKTLELLCYAEWLWSKSA